MVIGFLSCGKGDDMRKKENVKTSAANGIRAKKPAGGGKKRRRRARKPVPMGIALRRQGIDEHTIAETFAYALEVLKGNTPAKDADKKLLIDFIKECTRHLGDDNKASAGGPVRVRLIHNVARPQRDSLAPSDGGEKPESGVATKTPGEKEEAPEGVAAEPTEQPKAPAEE
jgi:hypothetical protein